MNCADCFGAWRQFTDKKALADALSHISPQETTSPSREKVFKIFRNISPDQVKVVLLGTDPYPDPNTATETAFANKAGTPDHKLSPALQVLRESAVDYGRFHNAFTFDITLSDWVRQGVFPLNCALTTRAYCPGAHLTHWRQFTSKLLRRLSDMRPGTCFVLLGDTAKSFKDCINGRHNYVFEAEHPTTLARQGGHLPNTLFRNINKIIAGNGQTEIDWYNHL